MGSKLVSIIVPVYNILSRPTKGLLGCCMKSLLEQTYHEIEIILVDDGSTDGTLEACQEYSAIDGRVLVCRSDHVGPNLARTEGLHAANGEYIGFVDGDDWVSEDYIERLVDALERTGADVSAVDFVCMEPGDEVPSDMGDGSLWVYSRSDALRELLIHREFDFMFWQKLYRRDVLPEVFSGNGHYSDMYPMFQIFSRARRIVKCRRVCYFYRQELGSIIHDKTYQALADNVSVIMRLYREAVNRPGLFRHAQANLMHSAFYIGRDCTMLPLWRDRLKILFLVRRMLWNVNVMGNPYLSLYHRLILLVLKVGGEYLFAICCFMWRKLKWVKEKL